MIFKKWEQVRLAGNLIGHAIPYFLCLPDWYISLRIVFNTKKFQSFSCAICWLLNYSNNICLVVICVYISSQIARLQNSFCKEAVEMPPSVYWWHFTHKQLSRGPPCPFSLHFWLCPSDWDLQTNRILPMMGNSRGEVLDWISTGPLILPPISACSL